MIKKTLYIYSIIFILFSGTMVLPAQASMPAVDSQGQALPTLAPMLKHVTPAVVNIATEGRIRVQDNPLLQDPFFRFFFNIPEQAPRERRTQSLGSGVIVDARKGYLITNDHVSPDLGFQRLTADDLPGILGQANQHLHHLGLQPAPFVTLY